MPPLHLHRLPRLLRAMSLAFCLALVQAAAREQSGQAKPKARSK